MRTVLSFALDPNGSIDAGAQACVFPPALPQAEQTNRPDANRRHKRSSGFLTNVLLARKAYSAPPTHTLDTSQPLYPDNLAGGTSEVGPREVLLTAFPEKAGEGRKEEMKKERKEERQRKTKKDKERQRKKQKGRRKKKEERRKN